MSRISVVGAGAFGTAMAIVAARCGHEVMLWAHDPKVAEEIAKSRTNPYYLRDVPLDSKIHPTSDLAEAAAFSTTIFMVVPSHHYRHVLSDLLEHLTAPVHVISGTKGIENDTLDRVSEITSSVLGSERLAGFATLSGPTFALETARGDPTAAVIASEDLDFARDLQRLLSCGTFRLYSSTDVVGVELSGSLKNIIAIAAGVVEGLSLGMNTNAALVTRGLHEITRLGLALGGKLETFAGLAGMGDLVLTCTGSLSRNRTLGTALGKGKKLDAILAETRTVAEGVKTSRSVRDLSERHRIEMPISTEMYRLLYENESPQNAIHRLMSRSLKPEGMG
ncbi:MAG TPA: NAD(P)H-dependent glycerol-3-phosphate dehydrogenase [Thermoanaerobaculia bacterium]|nr:NAD(P)H-dependent glycerol-3-phosphate dehydrogenase [Thermoanaerobaculia bacterium]